MSDPDIEAIVDELFTALRRRLYKLRDADSCRLTAYLRDLAAKLEQAARLPPSSAMQCQNCVSTRVAATTAMQTTQPGCVAATHSRELDTMPVAYCHLMHARMRGGGGILKQPCIPTPPSLREVRFLALS